MSNYDMTDRGPPMTTEEKIDNWFCYHSPTPEHVDQYGELRAAGKVFALAIAKLTPQSADQSAALRLVREAVMTANASIACGGE